MKPAPKKPSKAVAKPAPKPSVKPSKPVAVQKRAAEPGPTEKQAPPVAGAEKDGSADTGKAAPPATHYTPTPGVEIPPAGTIVSAANLERWKHLLGPSVQWAVSRGATMPVIDPLPTPMEPLRAQATQRYHAQVSLSADKLSMQNYVAGIPFPFLSEDDPDIATKLIFNFENRIVQDDLDVRNFGCETGSIDATEGVGIERHYLTEHFRRLFYISRFHHDPKPTWVTKEGVRYREMLYPLREPFDLKGAGFTYIRYLNPSQHDDSWLYLPQIKRVRRLSTSQRSEGVFGQDVDLDSYGGYSGKPAWSEWTYLGKKTILASFHARNLPGRYQAKPADFFPDDVWEPREAYIILGISRLGGYSFGQRVIYIDRDSLLIPYTELYDLHGALWKGYIHTWKFDKKPIPTAKRAVYDYELPYIAAASLLDIQLNHMTRCRFPDPDEIGEEGWYENFGTAEGTTEESFSVSRFIDAGR